MRVKRQIHTTVVLGLGAEGWLQQHVGRVGIDVGEGVDEAQLSGDRVVPVGGADSEEGSQQEEAGYPKDYPNKT